MLISPTEPALLRAAGTVNNIPERFGADILVPIKGGWLGVQRKEVSDLVASIEDGRLGVQVQQLKRCKLSVLVIEGRVRWTSDGAPVGKQWGLELNRASWRKVLYSVRAAGVWVEWSDDVPDTLRVVEEIAAWCNKDGHSSLTRRPGPQSVWGKADSREYAIHLFMGIPGVGPELAARVIERFGSVPWRWSVSKEELMTVKGIGPKLVERMWGVLPGE